MMLWVLAVCLAVVSHGYGDTLDEMRNKFAQHTSECIKESKIEADDLAQLMMHKVPEKGNVKCHLFCMHKHLNFQNEDGKFNKEGAYATLEKAKAVNPDIYNRFKAKLDGCSGKHVDVEDPCENAAKIMECIHTATEDQVSVKDILAAP